MRPHPQIRIIPGEVIEVNLYTDAGKVRLWFPGSKSFWPTVHTFSLEAPPGEFSSFHEHAPWTRKFLPTSVSSTFTYTDDT